jgi:hypothetical protein
MVIVGGILLGAAVFLWVWLVLCLGTINDSDQARNGLTQAFAALLGVGWTVVMGVVLLMGGLSRWEVWAPAWVGAAVVTVACVFAMGGRRGMRWLVVVPVLGPGLVMGYAGWRLFGG